MMPKVRPEPRLQYVVVLIDGAPDLQTYRGQTPLEAAHIPHMDRIAREGVTGLMTCLYPDLPKGSLVAQLGLLGWDPRKYYPNGRASAEALALGLRLNENDIAFRGNLVLMEGATLASYSANHIPAARAQKLVNLVNSSLGSDFPNFELANSKSFRNSLVIRNANVDPAQLECPEPHEHQGEDFDIAHLVSARSAEAEETARLMNLYLARAAEILQGKEANGIFLWSPSGPLVLPRFHAAESFGGKCAIIAYMDFLKGIAVAGGLEFFARGNGCVDTDYEGKGRTAVELLNKDYRFIYCHVNAPDEAAHTGIITDKIKSIEQTDLHIVGPLLEYFERNAERLGGLMVAPDHYTNTGSFRASDSGTRKETHTLDPVPFALWDNQRRDGVSAFSEKSVVSGRYCEPPISHLDLLGLFWNTGDNE